MIETARREFKCKSLKYHDHVTKNIVTLFIFNARRPTVHMRPNLYEWDARCTAETDMSETLEPEFAVIWLRRQAYRWH